MNHSKLYSLIEEEIAFLKYLSVTHFYFVLILGPSLQLEGYVLSKQSP